MTELRGSQVWELHILELRALQVREEALNYGRMLIDVGYRDVSVGVDCDHGADVNFDGDNSVDADEVVVVAEYRKKDESMERNFIDFWE